MKKMLLLMMCIPAVLSAQSVSGLEVGAGTVTFNVSWDKPDVPGGKAWVFVDYNDNGVMTRLLVSDATVSAGTVTKLDGNDQGVWVINSENVDNFSAMVTLSFTSPPTISGACAYASGYPPVGEYISTTHISFTGTPMYNIVLENAGNDTIYRTSGADFDIPAGYALVSFTDVTGAPGIMKCISPATFTLIASASGFCAGSEGVQFALSGTESGKSYQLYHNNSAVGAVLNGKGNAATFTESFDDAGTYTALTIADELYCAIAMSGSHVVIENPLPADPDVNNASRDCPGTVTLSASSSDAVIDWYTDVASTSTLYTGASYTTPEIFASTTYYVQAQSAVGCLSARVAVAAEVDMEGCCDAPGATVTFTEFNPCPSAAINTVWYLTDTRAGGNNNTYKVKNMADGRIWMVQDLKFGSCGTGTSTWYRDAAAGAPTHKPTVYADDAITYVGHCKTNNQNANAGYWYNWPAAMNNVNAWEGSGAKDFACSGTTSGTVSPNPGYCKGICPDGWHVPTREECVDAHTRFSAPVDDGGYGCSGGNCWVAPSPWEGLPSGRYYNGPTYGPNAVNMHTSSYYTGDYLYGLYAESGSDVNHNAYFNKYDGMVIRCVRNY
jgi:uncharacterized protein (TIGR02145 family)